MTPRTDAGPAAAHDRAITVGVGEATAGGGEEACLGLVLVGDIGGTHARLGLADLETGRFEAPSTLLCSDHAGLEDLLAAYRLAHPGALRATQVAMAVAGPVIDGTASFTNLPWSVSEAGLKQAGFGRAAVINDFEALALAAPRVTAADKAPIGAALPSSRRGTIALLGPGTGLGAAAWCVDVHGAAALVSEGGHVGFSPSDEVELEVCRILARRFGRVSLERILSGPGLVNLHGALGEIEGSAVDYASPAEVLDGARRGEPSAEATLQRFCSILGAAAGDFALAYGAVGGVLLAGGLAPRMLDRLNAGGFRAAFERKGRLSGYVEAIPTEVITHPYLALVGAAERLRRAP